MAKKPIAPQANAPADAAVSTRIELTPSEFAATFYVNYLEVGQTMGDFTLFGSQLPAKLSKLTMASVAEEGVLRVPVEIQITFPLSVISGLIQALMIQKELFERTHNVSLQPSVLTNA